MKLNKKFHFKRIPNFLVYHSYREITTSIVRNQDGGNMTQYEGFSLVKIK